MEAMGRGGPTASARVGFPESARETPDNRVTFTVEFREDVWAKATDETRAALIDQTLTRLRCHMLVSDATVGRVS